MTEPSIVMRHYGTADLIARLDAALRAAGFSDGPIPPEALAALDQFHVGGAAATADLAARLAPVRGACVLDIGSGLGGPARMLAATFGAQVTGVDLTQPFVAGANWLTARAGLTDNVRFIHADATALPFAAASFDAAWTQHVAMNIADRATLYAGIYAVLRPGGRFAIYDVVAGDGGPVQFPVPWARDPAASHLLTMDATRAVLETAGFVVRDWRDATDQALQWQQAVIAAGQSRPEALRAIGLPLAMGPDFAAMTMSLGRNLAEKRVGLLQAVVERPVLS